MKSGEYDQAIRNAVLEYMPRGYDWRIYKAQVFQESSFNPRAVSPAGARGLAQIMPGTWDQYKLKGYDDPFDPVQSLMVGARYMGYLYGQWSSPRPDIDRICLALASFNAGLGHILSAQNKAHGALMYGQIISKLPDVTGEHSEETISYVKKILGYWVQEITR